MWRLAVLGFGVVQAQFDLKGAIQWINDNSQDIFETSSHCLDALKIGQEIYQDCGQAVDVKNFGALAAWGMLEALEYVKDPVVQEIVKSPVVQSFKEKAMHRVEAGTHKSMDAFCQSECQSRVGGFDKEYSLCSGSALCAAMSANLDFEKCKGVMEKWLPKSMHIQEDNICAKEGEMYCQEEIANLLLKNPKCFMEFNMPIENPDHPICSEECVGVWKSAQQKHPLCMKEFERKMIESRALSLAMVRDTIPAMKDPAARRAIDRLPNKIYSFSEVCLKTEGVQLHMLV